MSIRPTSPSAPLRGAAQPAAAASNAGLPDAPAPAFGQDGSSASAGNATKVQKAVDLDGIVLPGTTGTGDAGLSTDERRRAELLTSIFENGSLDLQYGYAEALGDGRGITAGRAGFTSGTGDMLEVVRDYTRQKPNNPLAHYLPALTSLAKTSSASTKGLTGLPKAWAEAAKDPAFRAVQDGVVDRMYYQPSAKHADALGLHTPLARAQIYDAIIQHGDGDDPDGLAALIARTNAKVGGSPAQGVPEQKWLDAFLTVRRQDLAHAHDPSTRKVWAESVGRVDVFRALEQAGNWNLKGPLHVTQGGYGSFTIP